MTRVVLVTLLMFGGVAKAETDLEAVVEAAPTCEARQCFPIDLHVATDAHGLATTPKWIATQLERANHYFEPLDVAFQLAAVEELPASAMHVATRADRNAIAKGHVGSPRIHVFIVARLDDIDTPGDIIYGVTWHARDATYILVSAEAWERTLGHELGHFFGLPHSTHEISIMNQAPRDEPPQEERRFADEELDAMRPVIQRMAHLLRSG